MSASVQGRADVGRLDRGGAAPVGESGGVGLVAVPMGVGGITVGLEREEPVPDGDHLPVAVQRALSTCLPVRAEGSRGGMVEAGGCPGVAVQAAVISPVTSFQVAKREVISRR